MARRFPTLLLTAMLLAPAAARGDRGALSIEVSPIVTWWPSMPPAVGSGSGVSGTAAGALVGVRYGLRNDLELTASGFYEGPAEYTHTGVTLDTDAGTFTGALTSKTSRWGALVGARYVRGLVFRVHVGAEIGWTQRTSTALDLVNVSDPSNPHSYGLGLPDESQGSLVIAPLAGVEWQVTDHWSVSFMPRAQVLLGGIGAVAIVLPFGVGYSWYRW
jgi:hypothetical protein